jgi:ABC-2 type transport system ATP-binding protein
VSENGRTGNGIEVEGLIRDFKGGVRAVDGIDLQVAPGEIYGFLGPNGAGKSTTVLVLTTLLPPTGGRARVAGFDVVQDGPRVRRAIGASLQESALDPFLTGTEHMRLQSALHGLGKAEREARGRELLARVGLSEAADRKVGGYSGGMKRRLDLALALVHRPRLLFLDEPTTGLDIQSRTALWDEVRRLADDGVTVFLTTQYLEEADLLADRLGIIDRGKIVAEGTPAELKETIGRSSVEAIPGSPAERERAGAVLSRFGESAGASRDGLAIRLPDGAADLAEIVRALDAEGLSIADLRLHSPSLDDVFLAKTGRSLEGAGDREDDRQEQPSVEPAIS